jgi:bifunctional non-homologous end joining protein LigD
VKILSHFSGGGKRLIVSMLSRFVVHQHKTGRVHFDLRIIHDRVLRSWSLLREPPCRIAERRLAIERESFTVESIACRNFEEEAFGQGKVQVWDEGEVQVIFVSTKQLTLAFRGNKLSGNYELRKMRWYPGNRWLLKKLPHSEPQPSGSG